jgi:chemotaxis protein methyltransferase CheR
MDDFLALKKAIEQALHIQCENYKEAYIKRRLLSRMRSTNTTTYEEYLRYLRSNPEELEKLRNALTINVTEFFRDTEVFELIKRELLPSVLSERKKIRIWCAGCSSGEEAYSLAMILYDLVGSGSDLTGVIYATDIDEQVLSRAREGTYDQKSLKKMTDNQIRRHFIDLGDGTFAVKPHLKAMIRFSKHDLMSGVPIARYLDLVTCRNVTIYFTEGQKNDLAKTFHTALVQGGYYVMGKTEYLGREIESLFVPFNAIQKVFVKAP